MISTDSLRYFRRLSLVLLFLLTLSGLRANAMDVSSFDELLIALQGTSGDINVTTNTIKFDYSFYTPIERNINFTSSFYPANLEGGPDAKGFTAGNGVTLNFENISFSNMQAQNYNDEKYYYGAALTLLNANAVISGKSSAFTNNQAYNGGAIYVTTGDITFNDYVNFSSNKANVNGGAILLNNSAGTFNAVADFNNNQAKNGGAIAMDSSNISFSNSTDFTSNKATSNGGAVYLNNNSAINFLSLAQVQSNSAANGGGFYLNSSNVTANSGINIENNTASFSGGGFAAENNSLFEAHGQVNIKSNNAEDRGGGFYLNSSDADFYAKVNIESNHSALGGGFAAENNSVTVFNDRYGTTEISYNTASQSGGGFYLNNSVVAFFDNFIINNNTSNGKGGGFTAANNSLVLAYKESHLLNNTAYSDGGGFFAGSASEVSLGNSLFKENISYGSGGGFAADNAEVLFDKPFADFNFNSASVNGGGFSATDGSKITFDFDYTAYYNNNDDASIANFTGNTAGNGAGFYLDSSDVTFIRETNFNSNKASFNGGGFSAVNNSNVNFVTGGVYPTTITFINNSAANGAGFYLNNSTVTANWSTAFAATGNTAFNNGGGFVAENNSAVTAFADTDMTGNSAQNKGGGFFADTASMIDFVNSTTNISNNNALYGGGFAVENDAAVFINSWQSITLNDNSALSHGGGFYSDNAAVGLSGTTAEFNGNISGGKGGGFFATNNSLVFAYNNADFFGNTAQEDGGGFYIDKNAGAAFEGSVFAENTSHGSGGGFAANSAEALFEDLVSFTTNTARANGGGFSAVNDSTITFEEDVIFFNNTAQGSGGAAYIDFSDNISIQGQKNTFTSNRAGNSGGALFINNSDVSISGDNIFTGNTAGSAGGAAAIIDNSNVSFGQASSFTDNSADAGGALFIDSSDVTLTNSSFTGNTASSTGGAIYIQGSQHKNASLNIDITTQSVVFSGNTAKNESNALHIGNYSSVNFKTLSGTSVEMHDGITSGNTDASLSYSGDGDFNFYGDASLNAADISIESQNGAAFNLKNGAKLNAGNFDNRWLSMFNMKNTQVDTVRMKSFNNDGTLNMEIFSSLNSNDNIKAAGDVTLGTNSVLNLDDDFADRNFRSKTFKLINYGGNINGAFDAVNFNSSVIFSTNPAIHYGDLLANWITVTYRGDLNTTNFAYLSGLSFNQKEVANTFDILSNSSTGDLDDVISAVEAGVESDVKKALSQTSGYFLANVMRSAAIDSESKELYYRIKNHCSYGQISGGLWAQFNFNSVTNFSDENSPKDYNDVSKGIMAGYDMYNNEKVIGFYAKHNSHDIKQDSKNEADVSNTGVGIYGGIVKYNWEVKGTVSGSYDNYSTDRYIPFLGRKAEADFHGMTFGADIEGALKYKLTYDFILRPFIGLEIKNTSFNSFMEKNAASMNLDVEEGDYTRSAVRAGIGTVYEKKAITFYINGEMKYLLNDDYPQIISSFADTNLTFKSRGAEEGRNEFGASTGVSLRITEPLKVFANTNYFAAKEYSNFYVNIGVRYNFCNLKLRKEPKPYTTQDGFSYAPPPDFTDYSPIVKEEEKEAIDEELSEAFFDSLISGILEQKLSEDMQAALGSGNNTNTATTGTVSDSIINIELVKLGDDITEDADGNPLPRVPKTYVLNMSNFVVNRAALTEKAKNDLLFIAQEIMRTKYANIKIEGHTDATGNDSINSRLSRERAKSVYEVFVRAGIAADKMTHVGIGSKKPIAPNNTKSGRSKNRRVEVIIE